MEGPWTANRTAGRRFSARGGEREESAPEDYDRSDETSRSLSSRRWAAREEEMMTLQGVEMGRRPGYYDLPRT